MRIDVAAHLGHWPFQRLQAVTAEALRAQMDQLSVDVSLVSNLNGLFYANCQEANEELADWLRSDRRNQGRFVPLAVLNPTYPGWRRDLATCRGRFGMIGVRLYPQYHDYDLADPALHQLLLTVRDLGWPAFFSLRMIDVRGRSWLDVQKMQVDSEQWLLGDLAPVLAEIPDLKLVVLQSYFQKLPAPAAATFKSARVLFDTSRASACGVGAFNAYDLPKEIEQFGLGKFAFGSMTPFGDPISPLLRIEAAQLPTVDVQRIWAGNAQAFFGL